jgi:hypothetical protein
VHVLVPLDAVPLLCWQRRQMGDKTGRRHVAVRVGLSDLADGADLERAVAVERRADVDSAGREPAGNA